MSDCSTSASAVGAIVSSEQIVAHEGLVRWVVRQQWLGTLPFDDALHEGRLALWCALRHYDPSRGTAFSTYAVPTIARAVWRAVARHDHPAHPACNLPIVDRAVDPAVLVHTDQVEGRLLDLVNQLPARLRGVIVDHYGLGDQAPQTFAAIGQRLGVSKQRIQQMHVTAILWLAHPAHSLALRRLLDRHERADYQRAIAHQREMARARHRSRRGGARGCRRGKKP